MTKRKLIGYIMLAIPVVFLTISLFVSVGPGKTLVIIVLVAVLSTLVIKGIEFIDTK